MDDYLESCPTVEEATRKAEDLVKLLLLGGFKLTKLVSNVPSIPAQLATDPTTATEVKEIPSGEKSSHVLGLKWNHATDTLVVSRGTNPDIKPLVTQRVVLSLVSSVYDPIGLVAPYTVKARLLLKDIWILSGQQWDDDLPPDIVTKFLDWTQELPALSDIAIARTYFQGKVEALELHIFGDSSQEVFSAVVFLRGKVISGNGCPQTNHRFRVWKSQSGTHESHDHTKTRALSLVVCSKTKEGRPKGSDARHKQDFHVDRQHHCPTMDSLPRKATSLRSYPCGGDLGANYDR